MAERERTFVQVPREPLAGGAGEARGGAVDHGAGLPALGLCASAVAELRPQDQEAPGRGGFYGGDPGGTDTSTDKTSGI